MFRHAHFFIILALLFVLQGCNDKKPQQFNSAFGIAPGSQETSRADGHYDLDAIVSSGEIIVATLSGPNTYFDYQGRSMGLQYALAADFAHREGVSIRIETAHDTTELYNCLRKGDADLIALPLSLDSIKARGFIPAGVTDAKHITSWAIRKNCPQLAQALQEWYNANLFVAVKSQEEERFKERRQVHRRIRAPYLSQEKGIISSYDDHFKQAAVATGMDWRLIAAQCYQESGFDPYAVSWAGARGLMQIMPETARGIGVTPEQLYSPDINISTAARYLSRLQKQFTDVRNPLERVKFILAAYNGGAGHVRDAMALARKYGGDSQNWADVSHYVRHLTEVRYYRDPVVRYGYMIGNETANYVDAVLSRWQAYGGDIGRGIGQSGRTTSISAHRAPKKNRFTGKSRILSPEELEHIGNN